jgi:hypothetical protein
VTNSISNVLLHPMSMDRKQPGQYLNGQKKWGMRVEGETVETTTHNILPPLSYNVRQDDDHSVLCQPIR